MGGSEDEAEHSQEVIANHSVQAQSSDRLTRQLARRSLFRTSGSASRNRASGKSNLISIHDSDDEGGSEERRSPVSLSPGSGDETVCWCQNRSRRNQCRKVPEKSFSQYKFRVIYIENAIRRFLDIFYRKQDTNIVGVKNDYLEINVQKLCFCTKAS